MKNQSQSVGVALKFINKAASISKRLDNNLGAIHGVGLTEYLVLHTLSSLTSGTLKRIDIAESLGRTASGVTRVLLPMEKIGLIEKEVNQRDARVSLVKITSSGASIYRDASITIEQKCSEILNNWNDNDTKLMLGLLGKI